MKKLVTIFALFTMVMLTSFVEPSDIGGRDDKQIKTRTSIAMEIGGRDDKQIKTKTSFESEIGGRDDKQIKI